MMRWWWGEPVCVPYLIIISLEEDCEAGTPYKLTCSACQHLLCQTLFCEPTESRTLVLFIVYLKDQLDTCLEHT